MISFRDAFMLLFESWPNCRVRIVVERLYSKRSDQQNRYYWGVIINEFVDGYTDTTGEKISKDEAHDFLKARFNYREIINRETGEVARVPKSTSALTTSAFMDYQAECVRFIGEWFGRVVPEPGEQKEMEL